MKNAIILIIFTAFSSIAFAQNSTTGNPTLDNAVNKAKSQSGSFNPMAANPFILCSAPKPGKHNPMRLVWEQICPDGNKQAAAAPVPVPAGATTTLPNTTRLQEQFNQNENINVNNTVNGSMNNTVNNNIRSNIQ